VFPNIRLKLFIFPSQPFRKQRVRSGVALHTQPFISKAKQQSRSHPSIHPTVLFKCNDSQTSWSNQRWWWNLGNTK